MLGVIVRFKEVIIVAEQKIVKSEVYGDLVVTTHTSKITDDMVANLRGQIGAEFGEKSASKNKFTADLPELLLAPIVAGTPQNRS